MRATLLPALALLAACADAPAPVPAQRPPLPRCRQSLIETLRLEYQLPSGDPRLWQEYLDELPRTRECIWDVRDALVDRAAATVDTARSIRVSRPDTRHHPPEISRPSAAHHRFIGGARQALLRIHGRLHVRAVADARLH